MQNNSIFFISAPTEVTGLDYDAISTTMVRVSWNTNNRTCSPVDWYLITWSYEGCEDSFNGTAGSENVTGSVNEVEITVNQPGWDVTVTVAAMNSKGRTNGETITATTKSQGESFSLPYPVPLVIIVTKVKLNFLQFLYKTSFDLSLELQ